jgi:hypothetical protein
MPPRQRESQPYANETSSWSITFSVHVLGIVHASARPVGHFGQVGAAVDVGSSAVGNSLGLAARSRGVALLSETKRRTQSAPSIGYGLALEGISAPDVARSQDH